MDSRFTTWSELIAEPLVFFEYDTFIIPKEPTNDFLNQVDEIMNKHGKVVAGTEYADALPALLLQDTESIYLIRYPHTDEIFNIVSADLSGLNHDDRSTALTFTLPYDFGRANRMKDFQGKNIKKILNLETVIRGGLT